MGDFLKSRKKIVIGGTIIEVQIRRGAVEELIMGGKTYKKESDMAKSFTGKFCKFLEENVKKDEVFAFENRLLWSNEDTRNMLYAQEVTFRKAFSKQLKQTLERGSVKGVVNILETGIIKSKSLLELAREELEKPRGFKGVIYKAVKGALDFSLRDEIEKLSPKVDISKYTTAKHDFTRKGEEVAESQEVSKEDVMQGAMLDFMRIMTETQKSLLEKMNTIHESKVTADAEQKTQAKEKEGGVVNQQKEQSVPKEKQEEYVSMVDFGSKEVKDDILQKWGEARTQNLNESTEEYLNINTVRFDGVSLKKLNEWKENVVSKQLTDEATADGYVQKALNYAKSLSEIGYLKEQKPNEYEFTSVKAKEVLYANFSKSLNELKLLIDSTPVVNVNNGVKKEAYKNKVSESKNDPLVNAAKVAKEAFITYSKRNPNNKMSKEDYGKLSSFIDDLKSQDIKDELKVNEINAFAQNFLKAKEGKLDNASLKQNQNSISEDEINLDPSPYEDVGVDMGFEAFAKASANAAFDVKPLSSQEEDEQKIAQAVIDQEVKKQEDKEKEKAKQSSSTTMKQG